MHRYEVHYKTGNDIDKFTVECDGYEIHDGFLSFKVATAHTEWMIPLQSLVSLHHACAEEKCPTWDGRLKESYGPPEGG